jgi:hypothetical protein
VLGDKLPSVVAGVEVMGVAIAEGAPPGLFREIISGFLGSVGGSVGLRVRGFGGRY